MKQIVAVGCLTVLALIVMDTSQVVVTPSGLTVARGGKHLRPISRLRRPSWRQSARGKHPSARAKAKAPRRRS